MERKTGFEPATATQTALWLTLRGKVRYFVCLLRTPKLLCNFVDPTKAEGCDLVLERKTGLEPATLSLGSWCHTIRPLPHPYYFIKILIFSQLFKQKNRAICPVLFGASGGTWTHTLSNTPLKRARLPFRHTRKRFTLLRTL